MSKPEIKFSSFKEEILEARKDYKALMVALASYDKIVKRHEEELKKINAIIEKLGIANER
jgi:predicted  nucleic acid-binding Zn-ribbon protein